MLVIVDLSTKINHSCCVFSIQPETFLDLLSCPSSPPLAYPWRLGAHSGMASSSHSTSPGLDSFTERSVHNHPIQHSEKPTKKTVMVGAEYEVLLQSALEDQAMFYEGEIARLTAELTRSMVGKESMTTVENAEIELLQNEIETLQLEIEKTSEDLLAGQAHEANCRATSRKLLSEQQVSNELLKKIQDEHRKENMVGKQQIEDLEQQIADLTANLKMRQQFSSNEELNNAQIFGTSRTDSKKQGNRGKKKGRGK